MKITKVIQTSPDARIVTFMWEKGDPEWDNRYVLPLHGHTKNWINPALRAGVPLLMRLIGEPIAPDRVCHLGYLMVAGNSLPIGNANVSLYYEKVTSKTTSEMKNITSAPFAIQGNFYGSSPDAGDAFISMAPGYNRREITIFFSYYYTTNYTPMPLTVYNKVALGATGLSVYGGSTSKLMAQGKILASGSDDKIVMLSPDRVIQLYAANLVGGREEDVMIPYFPNPDGSPGEKDSTDKEPTDPDAGWGAEVQAGY